MRSFDPAAWLQRCRQPRRISQPEVPAIALHRDSRLDPRKTPSTSHTIWSQSPTPARRSRSAHDEEWPTSSFEKGYTSRFGPLRHRAAGAAGRRARSRVDRALSSLGAFAAEGLVAQTPKAGDSVVAWLNPALAGHLEQAGLFTLAQLIDRINGIGTLWPARPLRARSEKGARRSGLAHCAPSMMLRTSSPSSSSTIGLVIMCMRAPRKAVRAAACSA